MIQCRTYFGILLGQLYVQSIRILTPYKYIRDILPRVCLLTATSKDNA